MRAAVFAGPRSIEVADRPDPVVAAPTDAVVRVMLTCVCGSDLWYYRGESPHAPGPIGHEFVGVVEQVGAVGLCGVIAARRLGAGRIIALSRNPARQALARSFGATDVLPQRGVEATQAVLELTNGVGVDAALECVGTAESMATAFAIARPGSAVGFVGVPHGVGVPIDTMFARNSGLR